MPSSRPACRADRPFRQKFPEYGLTVLAHFSKESLNLLKCQGRWMAPSVLPSADRRQRNAETDRERLLRETNTLPKILEPLNEPCCHAL